MRCLRRNMREFEYLPYLGTEEVLTEDEEHTGEFHHVYGDQIPMKGNISVPSGREVQTFYGEDIRYSHTLVLRDPEGTINERGIIRWKGELYDIQSVRASLNTVSVALKKRTTDSAEGDGE